MNGLICFFIFFLATSPLYASVTECRKAAAQEKLVYLRYNYGKLKLDTSKSSQEIEKICKDPLAAGCFSGANGQYDISVTNKEIQVGQNKCVVPIVTLTYDFSGSKIYITRDYDPCQTRAVLRHELQHFMVWKTSKEWLLKDLKKSLQDAASQQAKLCPPSSRCSTKANALFAVVQKVDKRWSQVELYHQNLLDTTDHSAVSQVSYTVCAPYSLKVGLF